MSNGLKIDAAIVAPWQMGALEVFAETWEHVLSTALMFGIRNGRRSFSKTEDMYKQAHAEIKKYRSETLTLEAVTALVAHWCGASNKDNAEEMIMAWAADASTAAVVAADRFGRAYFVAVSNRPQMALPL